MKQAPHKPELTNPYLLPLYTRLPVTLVRGKGAYLWDTEGKRYLDFFAGLAVANLGHCPKEVVRALTGQARRLWHVSNVFGIEEQGGLAKKLVELTGLSQAFFCNSGAEAIEACIKLARYYSKSTGRYEILVAENSFHGRTLGALSATMQEKYRVGFEPLVPGFKAHRFGDLQAAASSLTPQTCAILVEPIQGEGGVRIPPEDYLVGLRRLCDEKGLLLILDEVQVGMGRTGKLFAHQHVGIKPDLMAISKALGNGFPIGACLVNQEVASKVKPGIHASTFGGNPLACRIALAVLKEMARPSFLKRVAGLGQFFLSELKKIKQSSPFIADVRGKGLILACELKNEGGGDVVKECLKRGLLINCIQDRILRFVPPLIITRAQIRTALGILREVLAECES